MHDPIAALRDAYGSAPDTSTLKGLIRYLELWLDQQDHAPTDELIRGCKNMVKVLDQAGNDTEADLVRSGQLDESLSTPIRDSLEAYRVLHDVAAQLAGTVEEQDRQSTAVHLEALKKATQHLDRAQKSMAQWLESPVLRCPACGASGEDPCPECGLELLFPDPGGDPHQQSATLPQQYGPVYQAYQAVMQAEKSLSTIATPLGRLETHLRSLQAMTNSSLQESDGSQTLGRLLANLEESLEGVAQMREALRTRHLKNLREGWTRVFQAAIDHDRIRTEVVLELGGEEEKAALKASAPPPTQDSIVISGE